MFTFTITILTLLLILLPLLLKLIISNGKPGPNLPPGPRPLPIIGNLHMLGQLPHRALAKLAQKHGPIMSLRLGQIQTIIVSSPRHAEQVLKHHDAALSGRPETETWLAGKKAMAFAPYGDYWRRVRLLCMKHVLSAAKIGEFEELRRRETVAVVRRLVEAAAAREVVNMDVVVGELLENIMYMMVVGKGKEGENIMLDLKGVVRESLCIAGEKNLADFIPFFRPFDFQGITRRFKALKKRSDKIFDKIIDDHLEEENSGNQKDILGTILNLMNNDSSNIFSSFSRDNAKAIIYELFAAGIEPPRVTLIWNLAALLKNPRTMTNLQRELDAVVGKDRMVNESDLANLSYLDMVIKETFRLYPMGPLLIPHESMADVVIDGYVIPKKTRIIVNTWAIGRDPEVWSENVEEYCPERFVECNEIDVRGDDFRLIPFGAGRRGCPGLLLGLTSVRLILAQLVHCFDWELANGEQYQELDMTEKSGLATPLANNLLLVPTARLQIL